MRGFCKPRNSGQYRDLAPAGISLTVSWYASNVLMPVRLWLPAPMNIWEKFPVKKSVLVKISTAGKWDTKVRDWRSGSATGCQSVGRGSESHIPLLAPKTLSLCVSKMTATEERSYLKRNHRETLLPRLTAGREPLELAIVVRIHGKHP